MVALTIIVSSISDCRFMDGFWFVEVSVFTFSRASNPISDAWKGSDKGAGPAQELLE